MKMNLAAALMAFAFVLGSALRPAWAGSDRYELKVRGLDCPVCAHKLETKLNEVPGVKELKVDLKGCKATFHAETGSVSEKRIKQVVEDAGFVPGEFTVKHQG